MLLLLEAPGPLAVGGTADRRSRRRGIGFVSPDVDDPSAATVFTLLREADLDGCSVAIWNSIPWYAGNASEDRRQIRAVQRSDLDEAQSALAALLSLLPRLEVVVLLGRKAQVGWDRFASRYARPLMIVRCPHPNLRSLGPHPERRDEIRRAFESAREIIAGYDLA